MKRSTLNPQPSTRPYGYRVTYARQCNSQGRTERASFGCKHGPAHARRNAMSKAGFVRVLAVEPLTAKQFLTAFPPSRSQRGRQVQLRNQA